jgi:uncharacterized protein with HEPN domain
MRLESQKYLYDIREAAGLASQFTAEKTFAQYQQNPMMRLAVERALAIIGEALGQLARVDAPLAARVSDLRSIVAFRNILVHAYAQVDDRIVWDIIETRLPVLVLEVDALMTEGQEEQEPRRQS